MKLPDRMGLRVDPPGREQGSPALQDNPLRPEKFLSKHFRTGVQLPPSPPEKSFETAMVSGLFLLLKSTLFCLQLGNIVTALIDSNSYSFMAYSLRFWNTTKVKGSVEKT